MGERRVGGGELTRKVEGEGGDSMSEEREREREVSSTRCGRKQERTWTNLPRTEDTELPEDVIRVEKAALRRLEATGDHLLTRLANEEEGDVVPVLTSKEVTGDRMEAR